MFLSQLYWRHDLTLLAADFAPVTALAVGFETNVGRRKGKRRAKRVAAEAFVRKTGRSPGFYQEQSAGADPPQWSCGLSVALAWRINAMAGRWKYPRSARGCSRASAAGAGRSRGFGVAMALLRGAASRVPRCTAAGETGCL